MTQIIIFFIITIIARLIYLTSEFYQSVFSAFYIIC